MDSATVRSGGLAGRRRGITGVRSGAPDRCAQSWAKERHAGLAWPPVSAGRHVRRDGHELRDLLRGGRGGRAVPVRRRPATSARSSCTRQDAFVWHALPARASSRASGTATGCTGRTTRRAGCAATRTSCCSTRTRRAIDGDIEWHPSLYAYDFDDPERMSRPGLGAVHAQGRGGEPVLRLGQRPPAATSRTTTR